MSFLYINARVCVWSFPRGLVVRYQLSVILKTNLCHPWGFFGWFVRPYEFVILSATLFFGVDDCLYLYCFVLCGCWRMSGEMEQSNKESTSGSISLEWSLVQIDDDCLCWSHRTTEGKSDYTLGHSRYPVAKIFVDNCDPRFTQPEPQELTLFKNFDERRNDYDDDFTLENISKFIIENM